MENYNLESARELINSAEKELSKEFEKAEEIIEIFVHKCSLEKWIQFVSPKIHYLLLNMLNIILNSLNKGK